MTTTLGVIVLVVCAIGAVSVLSWAFEQAAKLFKPYGPGTLLRGGRSEEYLDKKLSQWEDIPHYSGRTWLFGLLPHYDDIKAADKHNYATVVYMDHPVKQYIHDVMLCSTSSLPLLVFPLVLVWINPVGVLAITGVVLVWLHFWWLPSTERASRRSAEMSRNLKPGDWRKIYQEVAESKEREDELVRALRRSGIRRL